jgi:hypothetical protein
MIFSSKTDLSGEETGEARMEESRISLDCSAKINEESVVSRELEGEAVMLNLASGVYFGLNEVGTRIWALIQEHGSLRKVLEAMQQEYEVAPQTLESDLLLIVEELRAKGLVSVSQRDEGKETGA